MKGKNCFVTLVVTICLLLAGCAKKYPPADVDFGPFADTKANMKIIENVYGHFMERVKGTSRIEKVMVELIKKEPNRYVTYGQERYGWHTEIQITIKIADDDKTIAYGQRWLPMARNYLFYCFGGGEKPGMSLLKIHSAYLYGLKESEITPDADTFVPDSFYQIIDRLALGTE
jgi:hypothetical protein